MDFFDSHAHYNASQFDDDREEVLVNLKKEGISKIINAGYDVESSEKAIELANRYNFIYATVGISPNDIDDIRQDICSYLYKLIQSSSKVVAIGEIGLDYHWNKENKEQQKEIFKRQIEFANECNLPIVIHTREAIDDMLHILKSEIRCNNLGVFHCCPLNIELITEALRLGYYISFAGPITYKSSKNADDIIKYVPEDRFLIETDSPYLSPEPNRGKRNDSTQLKFIANKIAEVKGIEIEKVAKASYKNTCDVFKIMHNV